MTPMISRAVGESAQMILVWVKARALGTPPPTRTRTHKAKAISSA